MLMVVVVLVVAAAFAVVAMGMSLLDSRLRAVEVRQVTQDGQVKAQGERLEKRAEARAVTRTEWPPRSAVYQVIAPRLPRAPGYDDDGDDGDDTLDESTPPQASGVGS